MKYLMVPFVIFFSSIIGGILFITSLSSLPDILIMRFDCFEGCFFSMLFLLIILLVLISTRQFLFQMQMQFGEGSMWVQVLNRFWGSRWVRIDYIDLQCYHLNRYRTLGLITKDGGLIEFAPLSRRKHNMLVMDRVVSILKGKGIGSVTEKEMIEMFKQGKLSFV